MVNTFLPYADFRECARVLDDKRLYKQIVECKQILAAIEANSRGEKYGFQNHPIVKMWQNYPEALELYMGHMFEEWADRRWGNHFKTRIELHTLPQERTLPDWLGRKDLHRSHRSNLLRKDRTHYGKFFEDDLPDDLEYVWVTE